MSDPKEMREDSQNEGRDDYFMDIDRMVNEGLGGGNVTIHNGKIGDTTVDTIGDDESDLPEY